MAARTSTSPRRKTLNPPSRDSGRGFTSHRLSFNWKLWTTPRQGRRRGPAGGGCQRGAGAARPEVPGLEVRAAAPAGRGRRQERAVGAADVPLPVSVRSATCSPSGLDAAGLHFLCWRAGGSGGTEGQAGRRSPPLAGLSAGCPLLAVTRHGSRAGVGSAEGEGASPGGWGADAGTRAARGPPSSTARAGRLLCCSELWNELKTLGKNPTLTRF